jgi:hypothetical protein
LYRIAGIAALITVLVMVLEMFTTLFPGGGVGGVEAMNIVDWFDLFHENSFMGLRNLGLMNMLAIFFTIPIYVALYLIHRKGYGAFAALAAILYFVGMAIYLAGNTAFSMLSLSQSYAAAATDTERTLILAAGKALLARGESHTPGTFLGFLLLDGAGIVISIVMLRARIFVLIGGPLSLLWDVLIAVKFLKIGIRKQINETLISAERE